MFGETTVVEEGSFQPTKTRKQKLLDKRKRQMRAEGEAAAQVAENTSQRDDPPSKPEKEQHSTESTVHMSEPADPTIDATSSRDGGTPQDVHRPSHAAAASAPKVVLPTPCVGGGTKCSGKVHGPPSTPPRVHRSKPSLPVGEVWPNVWDNARIAPSYYRVPKKQVSAVTSKEVETPTTARDVDDEEKVVSDDSPKANKEEDVVPEEVETAAATRSPSLQPSYVDVPLEETKVPLPAAVEMSMPPTMPPPLPPTTAPGRVPTVQAGTSPINDSEWRETILVNTSAQTDTPIIKQRTIETQTEQVLTMESSTDTSPTPFIPPPQLSASSSINPFGSGPLSMEGLSSLLPDFSSIAGPPGLSGRADATTASAASFPSSMATQGNASLKTPTSATATSGGVGYYDPMRVYSTMMSLQQQQIQQPTVPLVTPHQLQPGNPAAAFWAAANTPSATPPSSSTLIGGPPSGSNVTRHDQQQQHQVVFGDVGMSSQVQKQQQSSNSTSTTLASTHAYRGSNRYDAYGSGKVSYQQYPKQGPPPPSQRDSTYSQQQQYHRRQGGQYRRGAAATTERY
ncbi:conserved hypothetical protein [Perkinsus marinus ATCC 50983]|uniref:Uncharacterized protein n=1 Tax=Perkinsus marinus (strain ATCC 50983 / TXsc) TaxID=423536 RepID=C5KTC7_PERM5|nr:conserved hypothetical protein [Perkinsus marinus ATCC 50983]EER12232.1 conserved hypothetical protein [Perkinsus marinus ATCC 50983]|eukprot:XP_002780437.1 conserved hypothetical protein [Perkinsus marinus ATCC 50983]